MPKNKPIEPIPFRREPLNSITAQQWLKKYSISHFLALVQEKDYSLALMGIDADNKTKARQKIKKRGLVFISWAECQPEGTTVKITRSKQWHKLLSQNGQK